MNLHKKLIVRIFCIVFVFTFNVPTLIAKDKEYDQVVRNLQSTYQAKKVKIPFMWLARFAVKIVRPAGVKSFNFTLFEKLKFSPDTLDDEMQLVMRTSLKPEWIPLLRVRSRNGEQTYAYMREDGNDVKLIMVNIEDHQAAVIRATFDPQKLAEFINNPKIFGVSLNNKAETGGQSLPPEQNSN